MLIGSMRNHFGVERLIYLCYLLIQRDAPVDQLDRSSDYGSEGWEFESSRARQYQQDSSFVSIILDEIESNGFKAESVHWIFFVVSMQCSCSVQAVEYNILLFIIIKKNYMLIFVRFMLSKKIFLLIFLIFFQPVLYPR